jgi:hypothetical protein
MGVTKDRDERRRPDCILCGLPEELKEELTAGRSLPRRARPGPKSISQWLQVEHEINFSPIQVQNCLTRHGTYP